MSVAGFRTVYKDMQDLVNFVGVRKDVSFLVEGMNMCGGMWVTWEKNKGIQHIAVHNFFAILNNVMQTLEKEPELQKKPRVEYLVYFLKYVSEEVQKYPDMKDREKLLVYVQGLCCLYKSKDLTFAMLLAKAAAVPVVHKGGAAKKPRGSKCENARIARLLSELKELGA